MALLYERIQFQELPKYPVVRRDLALLIDENVKYNDILRVSKENGGKMLKEVGLFDYYKGKNIPKGKKSYGVSYQIQPKEKTLTEKEIDKIMSKIQKALTQHLDAELR